MGDQLQEAVERAALQWGPEKLNANESAAIEKMLRMGKPYRARLLEAQARGRWVEEQVRQQFMHLDWLRRGVDVVDPATGYKYEVLSGTDSNLKRHGRRMHDIFFRMLSF